MLAAPLGFFRGHLPPLVYLLPLTAVGWVAAALRSGAALSAGDLKEMIRLPQYRRHVTLALWTRRAALLCLLGFVWRPWVIGGDTGAMLGDRTADPRWAAAGLLLLLGSAALFLCALRAVDIDPYRKRTGKLRPPLRYLHRALWRALRPLWAALLLFAVVCLLGGISPFSHPVFIVLGRLGWVAACAFAFIVGFHACAASFQRRAKDPDSVKSAGRFVLCLAVVLYALPFATLSIPDPRAWNIAAISPVAAWLSLFPGTGPLLRQFPFWPVGALPPFSACVIAPLLMGLILGLLGYARAARQSRKIVPRTQEPTRRAAQAPARTAIQFAAQTAALLHWVTGHTDNPIFTHEVRARTRSGSWFTWVYTAPILLLLAVALATLYPDIVNAFSFVALFHFFRHSGFGISAQSYADLAAIVLSGQIYLCGFGGLMVGENLIAKDQQRGILGFILMTPLSERQIFWGKAWGQSSGYLAGGLLVGTCTLLLSLLAGAEVGLLPSFIAWTVCQIFAACLFLLGVSLGAALATHTLLLKSLRGISALLLILLVGGGAYLLDQWLPSGGFGGDAWPEMAARLLSGSLFCLILSLPAFAYAIWRLSVLRRRDIPFGDSLPP